MFLGEMIRAVAFRRQLLLPRLEVEGPELFARARVLGVRR